MAPSDSEAVLRLRLAGTFAVERAGTSLAREVGTGKAALLLRVLSAARGDLVPMDTLLEVLWVDSPPAKAEANVATLVSRLRRVLGATALDGGRRGYRVVRGPHLHIDLDEAEGFVVEAEARLAAGQSALVLTAARAALDLLGAGRVLEDDPAAEWALEAGRQAGRLVRRARAAGWRASADLGDHRAALRWAEDAVVADELDEEAHRAVISAYHRLGEPGEALRAYERLRLTLLDQLGADPGRETVALYEAILRGGALAGERTEHAVAADAGSGLVGRDRELAQLIDAWSEASRGTPGCVLVVGEPGIGKTRLCSELAEHARAAGALVLQARCYEAERSLFLQPIVDVVRAAAAGVAPELIARATDRPGPLAALVPDLERVLAPVAYEHAAGEIERRRTFESVASFLARLAHQRPLLVVMDDLHQAGPSSVELLHFALRWDRAAPLLVVATVIANESTGAVGLLAPMASRMELGPLPEQAVRSLAMQMGVADRADEVMRMTRGHTLFVVEALRALGGDAGGVSDDVPVPESLRSAVQARVSRCGDDVEAFLRAAVIAGSPFDLAWVADLLSASPEDMAALAERARKAGILVTAGTGYEFANELIRDVLYDTTPAPVRAMRHRRLAALLVDKPAIAARHAADAADWPAAASLWLDAGAHAVATLATREAEQLFTNALSASALVDDPTATAAAHLGRGRVRAGLGGYEQGAEDLTAAQQLARAVGASAIEAEATVQLGWCAYYARDLTRAAQIAERVAERDDAGSAAQLLMGRIRSAAGDLPMAVSLLESVAADDVDPATRAMALSCLGTALAHRDEYAAAAVTLDEALTACRHAGVLRGLLNARMFVIFTRGNLGQFADALAGAEALLADVERYDARAYRPRGLNMLAWMWRELGEFSRARDLAAEALEACEVTPGSVEGEPAANALLALAESALLDGDETETVRRLGQIDALLSDRVGYRWRIELRRLDVLCRIDEGRGEELLDAARTYGSAKYEALALHHLGRADLAVDAARTTGSHWLLARVAPAALARSSFDELAAQLPQELRTGFVARGPLAQQLTRR